PPRSSPCRREQGARPPLPQRGGSEHRRYDGIVAGEGASRGAAVVQPRWHTPVSPPRLARRLEEMRSTNRAPRHLLTILAMAALALGGCHHRRGPGGGGPDGAGGASAGDGGAETGGGGTSGAGGSSGAGGASGQCAATGASCANDAACCSGICDPASGTCK